MELEWKFAAATRPDLEGVTHRCAALGWQVAPTGRVIISDLYYDTLDRQLLAQGGCVRRRGASGKTLLTVKGPNSPGPDGLFSREEREFPFRPDGAAYLAQHNLIPTLRVHNSRRTFALTQGETAVELSLDRVTYRFGGKTSQDFQVELELKSPTGASALRALGQTLSQEEALTPLTESKYVRGMARTAPC